MRKLIADSIRKNAGKIEAARRGEDLRAAICESLNGVAALLDAEEIPIRKLVAKCYLKGIFIGAVIMQAIFLIIWIAASR